MGVGPFPHALSLRDSPPKKMKMHNLLILKDIFERSKDALFHAMKTDCDQPPKRAKHICIFFNKKRLPFNSCRRLEIAHSIFTFWSFLVFIIILEVSSTSSHSLSLVCVRLWTSFSELHFMFFLSHEGLG